MNKFSPIAIVGQGCVYPDANSPKELFQNLLDQHVSIHEMSSEDLDADFPDLFEADKALHTQFGYIRNFLPDFDLKEFQEFEGLGNLFHWSLHAVHQALRSAGFAAKDDLSSCGLIMGNLMYPTRKYSDLLLESTLKDAFDVQPATRPENRMSGGYPFIKIAQAFGMKRKVFSLDAACASSLYALKYACDELQAHRADVMVAGGVSAADELFLNMGFTTLGALSPSGQSRPFNQQADGLIPAQGAGAFVLKRLADAVADEDAILGVIRGIGLSNDGKSGGFLSPSSKGQVHAMKAAMSCSGITPDEVSFIECHATGTPKGDPVELESTEEVYGKRTLHIGSVKANLGHPMASSGVAGLIKILNGFQQKVLPGTPGITKATSILADSDFIAHQEPLPWDGDKKVAAISNFGFGGNNAHVLVQEWNGKLADYPVEVEPEPPTENHKVAVVEIDLKTEQYPSIEAFFFDESTESSLHTIFIDYDKLGFPPNDLKQALGQQLLAYASIKKVLEGKTIDNDRTGVFVGTSIQEGASYESLKNRMLRFLKDRKITYDDAWWSEVVASIDSDLTPGLVLGNMPNLPANRLNSFFDLKGESFTVACEELSGNEALDVAMGAISQGRLTSAIVCACDIDEPTLRAATAKEHENGVVTLLLKSEAQAMEDGDHILTLIQPAVSETGQVVPPAQPGAFTVHCASGLMNVASHAFAQATGNLWDGEDFRYAGTQTSDRYIKSDSYGVEHAVALAPNDTPLDPEPVRKIYTFAGDSLESMLGSLADKKVSNEGRYRLAVIAHPDEIQSSMDTLLQKPVDQWETGWVTSQAYFTDHAAEGEVAFVYTGGTTAYKKMAGSVLKAYPSVLKALDARNHHRIADRLQWIFNDEEPDSPAQKLMMVSIISQFHTAVAVEMLKVKPDVAMGFSAGETNSLISLGVISDPGQMFEELKQAEFYEKHLSYAFEAVQKGWQTDEAIQWGNYVIEGNLELFLERTAQLERVYVSMIHTDTNFVLSGDATACERLIEELDPEFSTSIQYDFAIHVPVLQAVEKTWKKIHTRKLTPRDDVRFYSEYFGGAFTPTSERVGETLTFMGLNPIDFRKVVKKAWDDGVRVFIEQGPRNNMTRFVSNILGDKPYITVSFDIFDVDSLLQLQKATSQLWALQIGEIPTAMRGELNPEATKIAFHISPPDIVIPPIPERLRETVKRDEDTHMMDAPSREDLIRFRFDQFVIGHSNEPLVEETLENQAQALEINAIESQDTFTEYEKVNGDHSVENLAEQHPLVWQYAKLTENRSAFLHAMNQSHQNYLTSLMTMSSLIGQAGELPSGSVPLEWPTLPQEVENEPGSHALPLEEETPENNGHELITNVPDTEPDARALPGPKFDRAQLEELASGKISNVFGPLFKQQDHYEIQVRMPAGDLLLCDRVTGIQAEAGSMSTGIMWTESDVREDSWYLHQNRMPAGIFIESGQADLLLVSWMGVDFHQNKGERAYRLLGCDLTFHDEMPQPGDTLKYEIHLDGYANMGDVSLFFFHYDCYINGTLRSSVRNGQAGFFTKKELAESNGVIWEPEEAAYAPDAVRPDLSKASAKTSFTREDIQAYLADDMVRCFGDAFSITRTHTRTPRAASKQMNFMETISVLDFHGGPAGRGYLKSEYHVSPDDWFFQGHFKNDHCMPGTLMAEACLQMMAFYLVAAGYTQDKDGWRFQPIPEESCHFVCRGQVTPESKKVTYEVFVDEIVVDGAISLYAHVLVTVDDSLKSFMCERFPIQLVPDFPITTMPDLLIPEVAYEGPVASWEGYTYDHASLVHCAVGNPQHAFGPIYDGLDLSIPTPRLPAPPYLFISRIAYIEGKPGDYDGPQSLEVAYDIPPDVWYFQDNLSDVMPYSVLLEVALQPCGWLSTYATIGETKNKHVLFRNLDGTATQYLDITPAHRTITTRVELTSTSILGDKIILGFNVNCSVDGAPFYEMKTVFGFFDPESMKDQKGGSFSDAEKQRLDLPSNLLRSLSPKDVTNSLALPAKDKLLMIDRMVYVDPAGGEHGKGYVRGEKDVSTDDWYFKAHFYSDPVQPGSLGIEALLQLIQAYLLHTHPETSLDQVTFEPVILGRENEWHYRGQVVPKDKLVTLDFDVAHFESSEKEVWVEGHGRLWANDLKIYHCPRIGVKMKWAD